MEQKKESKGIKNKIEKIFAAPIFLNDKIGEKIDAKIYDIYISIIKEYHDAMIRYKGTGAKASLTMFTMASLIGAMFLFMNHFTTYEYSYNGKVLGYVKDQEMVNGILEVAGDELSKASGSKISFETNKNIIFKKVSNNGRDNDSQDQALNKLTYMSNLEITGYGIYENNKLKTIVDSEESAVSALELTKQHYNVADKGMNIKNLDFKNKIEVKPVDAMLSSISNKREALQILTAGGDSEIRHIVKKEEKLKDIKEIYSAGEGDIKNIDSGNNKVTEGDIISIEKKVTPLGVELLENGTMIEELPYKTIEKKTKDLYKGDTEIKQKGSNGRQKITGDITKINGKIVKRDLTKKEVIKKPVDKIILVGTSTRPKTAPTGKFAMPIRQYTITSYFGSRWGSFHSGIDFANATGTPIYASDGGEIIRAGYFGGYGLCVEIQHKSGVKTRYGHCSQALVSTGDKVYQGQEIALVGNTGHSTGSHLHFEIILNGSQVDPLPYLGMGNSQSNNE